MQSHSSHPLFPFWEDLQKEGDFVKRSEMDSFWSGGQNIENNVWYGGSVYLKKQVQPI